MTNVLGQEGASSNDTPALALAEAREAIFTAVHPLASEIVALNEAEQRITAADVAAVIAQPSFNESTRDGFVIGAGAGSGQATQWFRIGDEIAAGSPSQHILPPGTACRIMTGGCIPDGGTRVVPFEECVERDGAVRVAAHLLQAKTTFIRQVGSEISQGQRLIAAGTALSAEHLALMAACAIPAVAVSRRPVVGYVCTGSELIPAEQLLAAGQKVSSNAFLLRGMIASAGGCPKNMGIVPDDKADLVDLFTKAAADSHLDVLITTGGMGPGKYDLVERAFVKAGGEVVFNAIAMRPGKSMLFGRLGQTLVFGLPGPPHAVRTLLHTLVGLALYSLQGITGQWPKKIQAQLQHQINIKAHDVMQLKSGVLVDGQGRWSVRIAQRLEMGNCFIVLPAGQTHSLADGLVDVYLALDSSRPHFWQCGQ